MSKRSQKLRGAPKAPPWQVIIEEIRRLAPGPRSTLVPSSIHAVRIMAGIDALAAVLIAMAMPHKRRRETARVLDDIRQRVPGHLKHIRTTLEHAVGAVRERRLAVHIARHTSAAA